MRIKVTIELIGEEKSDPLFCFMLDGGADVEKVQFDIRTLSSYGETIECQHGRSFLPGHTSGLMERTFTQ